MQVVFHRNDRGWVGDVDGVEYEFIGINAVEIFKKMKKDLNVSRVGFRSADIGPTVVNAFGPTVWMQ